MNEFQEIKVLCILRSIRDLFHSVSNCDFGKNKWLRVLFAARIFSFFTALNDELLYSGGERMTTTNAVILTNKNLKIIANFGLKKMFMSLEKSTMMEFLFKSETFVGDVFDFIHDEKRKHEL